MNKLVTKCVSASIKIKFQGKLCCSPWNRYFSDAMRFERPLLQVLVLELPAVAFLLLLRHPSIRFYHWFDSVWPPVPMRLHRYAE